MHVKSVSNELDFQFTVEKRACEYTGLAMMKWRHRVKNMRYLRCAIVNRYDDIFILRHTVSQRWHNAFLGCVPDNLHRAGNFRSNCH